MRAAVEDDMALWRAIDNVRFLIEQQIQLVDALDRRGLDQGAALDLLRRLLLQDAELRLRASAQPQALSVA